jgi:uncharacterized protein (TIGR02588 family)
MSEKRKETRVPADPASGPGQRQVRPGRDVSVGRTLAEWVTLGLSGLLVLSLAGYLLFQVSRPSPVSIEARTRLQFDQIRREGERYLLPLEVYNPGGHTLRDLKIEVRGESPAGEPETREVEIDYLGEHSTQQVYLYFDQEPRSLKLKSAPQQYRVD